MSATDDLLDTGYPNSLRPELHKALEARGIDYWVAQGITFWNRDDGCECLAYGYKADGVPKLAIKVVGFTDPEQAIAATLGRGTCHKVRVHMQIEDEMHCSECGRFLGFAGDVGAPPYNFCPNCGARVVEVDE